MNKVIDKLGSLQGIVTVLTGTVAAYIALVAIGNITDFDSNQGFVKGVLGMKTTFNDGDLMWRSIDATWLQNTAYIGVIIWEVLCAVVCIWGTVLLIKAFNSGAWGHARKVAGLGILMVMFLFAFGFITVGGEYFAMWQSSKWNGLDAAIRNFTLSAVPLILLQLPNKEWDE